MDDGRVVRVAAGFAVVVAVLQSDELSRSADALPCVLLGKPFFHRVQILNDLRLDLRLTDRLQVKHGNPCVVIL